jgi:D-ribose pyranose/furanose isomerase RbsD
VENEVENVVLNEEVEEQVEQVEAPVAVQVEDSSKKGTIFDSLSKLKKMFENQFKDNIE